jgi:hypothetical protein
MCELQACIPGSHWLTYVNIAVLLHGTLWMIVCWTRLSVHDSCYFTIFLWMHNHPAEYFGKLAIAMHLLL